MSASGPTAFYLMELARVVVPTAGILFVLAGILRFPRLGNSRVQIWLIIVTGVWLFVTFANRLLLIAPIRNYFFSAPRDYASAHQARLYFATGAFLWMAEEILLLAFGILFFFALRSSTRRDI